VGDEVATHNATRHNAKTATNAFVSPESFRCGCAALRFVRVLFERLEGNFI